jgi:hypothetical protein
VAEGTCSLDFNRSVGSPTCAVAPPSWGRVSYSLDNGKNRRTKKVEW